MYRIMYLTESEFDRLMSLYFESDVELKGWKDLRPYYVSHWGAGNPGSIKSIGDYLYENNGEYPPDEPWDEDWVSNDTLKAFRDYFISFGKKYDVYEFIAYMLKKQGNLYEFANRWQSNICYNKGASRKKIPNKSKKKLLSVIPKVKHPRYYMNCTGEYAVEHPVYHYLITEDGSVVVDTKSDWCMSNVFNFKCM